MSNGSLYKAMIIGYLGADYSFISKSYKWCYYQALHFAKQALYLHDHIDDIIIELSDGVNIIVDRAGYVVIRGRV